MQANLGLTFEFHVRRHFPFSLRTWQQGKITCGRLRRQTKNNFPGHDISQVLDRESPSLSPHFPLLPCDDITCYLLHLIKNWDNHQSLKFQNLHHRLSLQCNLINNITHNFYRHKLDILNCPTMTEVHVYVWEKPSAWLVIRIAVAFHERQPELSRKLQWNKP